MLHLGSESIKFRKLYILKLWIAGIFCYGVWNCAQAKSLPSDSLSNGLFFNLIASENSRMLANSFEPVATSVTEGTSRRLSIDAAAFSPFQGVLYLSEETVFSVRPLQFENRIDSTSFSTIEVDVFAGTDSNCEEEEHTLLLTSEVHSLVGKIRVRVLETDKCVFFANADGFGYSGNLNGIEGADEICQREKSEFLPGEVSEYKALLRSNLSETRRPANAALGLAGVDWPIRKNTRYFLHSNDADRNEFLFQSAFEAAPGDESGLFLIPLTTSIPSALLPNPNSLWSGFESPNFANGSSCGSWSSESGSSTGLFVNETFVSHYASCSNRRSILCIRL